VDVLATGREAEVFAVDDHRVLRRFRDRSRSAESAAVLLRRLTALGYPVPAVLSWNGADLVQERVRGPRMDQALADGRLGPAEAGAMLADLLDRLHALPWDPAIPEPLLHLDLHPQNVLLATDGPVVVDWSNARPGPPGLDVAMSGLILTQVAVAEPAYADVLGQLVSAMCRAVSSDPLPHVDDAVTLRRRDPHMTDAELAQMSQAAELLRSLC
jgi:aminoglycoside phosphotransferase (APT) family kinase protein